MRVHVTHVGTCPLSATSRGEALSPNIAHNGPYSGHTDTTHLFESFFVVLYCVQ